MKRISRGTLFDKVWDSHVVWELRHGQQQMLIDTHLIHEVTSPQAFSMIRELGIGVRFPKRTFATVDHIVPTDSESRTRPLLNPLAEAMIVALEEETQKHKIPFFGLGSAKQGIVHVVAPEQGLIHPGMTVACGDSHTSTHGAFGCIALGIGTTQVACVLGTQCLLLTKPKVRKIVINGTLSDGVTAKDVILAIINLLGVDGGIGYAYEYSGSVIDALDMEARMTICNMSIEGGAQCGYVNPDARTVEYLRGREHSPKGELFDSAAAYWLSLASDSDAVFDDVVEIDGNLIQPMMTWGINPGQSVPVNGVIPEDADPKALSYMKFSAGKPLIGQKVDVAFIGSCTNGRFSDFQMAAEYIIRCGLKVASGVKAIAVPGSEKVNRQAKKMGLDKIFIAAGFEWREAGCSMCLAMNPDKLVGDQLCASSSNRNFKGRQGSPTGRTVLMSPLSVVACAFAGKITDARTLETNA